MEEKWKVMQISDLITLLLSYTQRALMFRWLKSVPSSFARAIIYLSLALKCLLCPMLAFHSGKWSSVPSLLRRRHEQNHLICKSSVTKTKQRPEKHALLVLFVPLWLGLQKRDQCLNNIKTKLWNLSHLHCVTMSNPLI